MIFLAGMAFLTITIGFNKTLLYLFNIGSNELLVEVKEPLVNGKVKIELGCDDYRNVVIYNGEEKNSICNEYGEYNFLVSYDDRYYAELRHYRFNWHDQYSYLFELKKVGNSISLKVKIDGADGLESSLFMKSMEDIKEKL